MKLSKTQLANIGADKVRGNPDLFKLFEQYVKEDACLMWHDCKIPVACFACSFNNTFSRWRAVILRNNKKNKVMSNTNSTYQLKDRNTKLFFKGEIIDRNSPDEVWNDWINHAPTDEKRQKREDYFEVLPNSSADDKPKATKKATKPKAAKTTKVVKPATQTKPVEDPSKDENKDPGKDQDETKKENGNEENK